MYKLLLILKYLGRKLAPMFAALAVTLCTAMVIIVISVMGGFLSMLRDAAQSLTGDVVVVGGGYNGFPNYEDLIGHLEDQPEIEIATPTISSYGLVKLGDQSQPVQVEGVRAPELAQVVRYRESLYWGQDNLPGTLLSPAGREGEAPPPDPREAGVAFQAPKAWGQQARELPGIVLGIEVNPFSQRNEQGEYEPFGSAIRREVVLTVVPVAESGMVSDTELTQMVVVNEFKSGLYEIDANRAYVDFDLLQEMLYMDGGEEGPARTNQVLASAAPGHTPDQARAAAEAAIEQLLAQHQQMPPLRAMTWEQQHQTLLEAVENEVGLVFFLFAVISTVAVVMVATTFYMTVLEKVRDIGVLRALGASRVGIAMLYLGYGLAIGLVGTALGLLIAWAVVTNLNGIQELVASLTGWRMWKPEVYAFDSIPDEVNWFWTGWICLGAVASSVVGSLIPAILAARLDPVEAIRHE
jgi:lipoprotein-releasing system permease protein